MLHFHQIVIVPEPGNEEKMYGFQTLYLTVEKTCRTLRIFIVH